jgi:hypothetical protein
MLSEFGHHRDVRGLGRPFEDLGLGATWDEGELVGAYDGGECRSGCTSLLRPQIFEADVGECVGALEHVDASDDGPRVAFAVRVELRHGCQPELDHFCAIACGERLGRARAAEVADEQRQDAS